MQKRFDEVGRKIAEFQKKYGLDSVMLFNIRKAYETFTKEKNEENLTKLEYEVKRFSDDESPVFMNI